MKRRILRKFGFKLDQNGIINRYLRESENWDKHLKKSKDFILKTASAKSKNTAVILGSGWLLDVPVEELSDMFQHLILVDIVHPRQIEHKIKKFNNIELIEADVTGLIEPVYQHIKKCKKQKGQCGKLTDIQPLYRNFGVNTLEQANFIVSLNLLNQLDILICDYIKKHKFYSDDEILEFRKYIQSTHVQSLPKNKSSLISDYLELNLDDKDQVIKEKRLVHINLPDDSKAERWTWEFDTKKTYHSDCQTIFKVAAFEI